MIDTGLGRWPHLRRVKSAGHPALVHDGVVVTYDELADRVDHAAAFLHALGVRSGDRVAYLGENEPAFLEVLFAAGTLGAVFVPLNTRSAAPEIEHVLRDSGAVVLLHSDELADRAAAGCADLPVRRVGASAVADGTPPAGDTTTASITAAVGLDSPAMILYTSGTTGRPKGAVLTHGNMTWNCLSVLVDYDVTSTTVALMISPMFHVASLGMGVLPVLLKGGTVVLERGFEPGRALALVERHRVTSLSGVPTTFQMLCEHPDWSRTDLSSLRTLTCGGSAVPMRVLETFEERGLAFTGGYGMTETSPGATSLQPRYSRSRAGTAGLPMFFTRVRVAGPSGEVCAPHAEGEIQVDGPNVVRRYWQLPEATAEAFTADGWFRSGDLGRVDDDGFLTISGRAKDMIISGGENVYPAEIEQLVMELAAVEAVAVVGVPDDRWGEVPRAYVQLRPGAGLTTADLAAHLDGRLARFKIPRTVVVVDAMPRTATGKIRKTALLDTPV